MKVLTSPLLSGVPGLTHGFGQRMAGPRERAREAAERTLGKTGEVFFLKQVHGCTVAAPPWALSPEADASVTGEAGMVLAIETADCLPVLIVDPVGRRAAAAHAGWRGTAAGIARRTVEALVERGSNPRDLLAALGPAIGRCCYEVGGEVEESFGPEGAAVFFPGRGDRRHLDLVAANRVQLLASGLGPARIDSLGLCTRCREDLFFSYRRDGGRAGRMISGVGFSK